VLHAKEEAGLQECGPPVEVVFQAAVVTLLRGAGNTK
jgi:hypothetical protein